MTDFKLKDVDGKPISIGDVIEQVNFNGEQYTAIFEVVVDPRDNEVCLWMISGNEKAMSSRGFSSFGHIIDGRLKKGRVIGHI